MIEKKIKTKREVLEHICKKGGCFGLECSACPYYTKNGGKGCPNLYQIGAMAILRQNRGKNEQKGFEEKNKKTTKRK